jgi:hypothetical protein
MPLNIIVMRFAQDGMFKISIPTTPIVPLTVPVDAGLIVYVPAPPDPVPKAVMVVPAAMPVPKRTCPIAMVPVTDDAVRVVLLPDVDPVNVVREVENDVPRTIFCVDDHTDPSAVNSTLPAVVGEMLAPSPP